LEGFFHFFPNFAPEIREKDRERKKPMKIVTNIVYAALTLGALAMGASTTNAAPGDIFVSDSVTGGIYKFAPDGTGGQLYAGGFGGCAGLAFDNAGNLFAAGADDNNIHKFALDGTQTIFASGLNEPYGLAFDSAGYLFEADHHSATIYKFAPDGAVYTGAADNGSNFRIDSCQYIYNLNSSALGVGTYRVDIKINGQVVGSGVFALR
jgi:hypothetical protein